MKLIIRLNICKAISILFFRIITGFVREKVLPLVFNTYFSFGVYFKSTLHMKKLPLFFLIILHKFASYAQDSLLWKFTTGSAIYSSPVISGNSIYFGSSDNNLYAVEKTSGKLLWKFATGGQVNSSPAVYQNKVICSSSDGKIYSIDQKNGSLQWTFKTKGEQRYDLWDYFLSSPVVYDDIIYVGSGDSTIYSIRAGTGKILWSYKTNGVVHASPVLKSDTLFIGSYDGYFYALGAKTGKLIWKFKTVGDENFPKGEVQKEALIHDNTVVFGSRDYNIYALDTRTGTGKWNMKERGSWIIATPFFYKGNIYVGTSDYIKWTLPLNMRVYATASMVDSSIVFGCFNGKLYFVDAASGNIKSYFQSRESRMNYASLYDSDDHLRKDIELYGRDYIEVEKKILSLGSILSNPLVEDRTLYFGDTNGYFYALQLR
jgi:eukaryotic-like serine/threonine-protein kinase